MPHFEKYTRCTVWVRKHVTVELPALKTDTILRQIDTVKSDHRTLGQNCIKMTHTFQRHETLSHELGSASVSTKQCAWTSKRTSKWPGNPRIGFIVFLPKAFRSNAMDLIFCPTIYHYVSCQCPVFTLHSKSYSITTSLIHFAMNTECSSSESPCTLT